MVWLMILEEEIKNKVDGGGERVVMSLKIENGPHEFLFLICLSDSCTENEKRLQIMKSEFLVGNEACLCSCCGWGGYFTLVSVEVIQHRYAQRGGGIILVRDKAGARK